jgi:pyridoxal phosphate enzyme (YggS family)
MSAAHDVAERVARIRRRIDTACHAAGRDPAAITLIGASKQQPDDRLLAGWVAGVRVFGENRVQEAAAKRALLADAEWHLIGPLQSNKVRPAVDLFATFHALDRPKILTALAAEGVRRGTPLTGFVEVNLGEEASKHGFAPRQLAATLAPFRQLAGLRLVGLMAIPPPGEDAEASRPWFRRLRELRDELAATAGWEGFPGWLSMGMSDDYAVAIEEGATHVRVGSALFGPRP